jgi:hypothetical protein
MDQLSTTSLLPPRMLKLPQATAPAHIPKTWLSIRLHRR